MCESRVFTALVANKYLKNNSTTYFSVRSRYLHGPLVPVRRCGQPDLPDVSVAREDTSHRNILDLTAMVKIQPIEIAFVLSGDGQGLFL